MELEATWGRTMTVWWSFMWRLLLAAVASTIIGAVAGLVLGVVLAVLKVPKEAVIFFSLPVGLVIGLATSVVPIKLILGMDFGEFRLVLIAKQQAPG